MKNVFFTAIALVAFSAASMANTSEAKEEVKKKELNVKKDCAAFATAMCAAIEAINDECLTTSDYNRTYYYFKASCEV